VLGTSPDIVANYVETGKVKMIFWPMLDYGQPSINSTLAATCVGQQDPKLFWQMHELLFQNQRELWEADRGYFVSTAVSLSADQATFEACYDDPATLAEVTALDELRHERGIRSRPTFDINGNILAGSLPYETFAEAFDSLSTP
jgi:protein-disulfide isomerase